MAASKAKARSKENYDPDWGDSEDFELPPLKRKRRFQQPASSDVMKGLSKGHVPANTAKSTSWAQKVFLDWRAERNGRSDSDEQCPADLLDKCDVSKINYWLARFVVEVRRQDGQPYPPKTIHLILAGLQRIMLEKRPNTPKFLDRKEYRFCELRRSCDSVYRGLHKQGIGTTVHHTQIFTKEEEEKLWATGVLGDSTPKSLQRAIYFYIGKLFCVRGGQESRDIRPSQLLRSKQPDCYTYVEHGSKNINGGIDQLRVENKCVPCYAIPDKVPRCLVHLLDRYLDNLPKYAFEKDIFYCRPKVTKPLQGAWYDSVAVGKNKLGSMVKDLCTDAGLPPRTNHSLRATGATALFQAEVPERIIQKTTGYRSLDSLRTYERISTDQQQAVSQVMMSNQSTSFSGQLRQVPSQQINVTQDSGLASGSGMAKIFGDLTNCSIGQITVNVNPNIHPTISLGARKDDSDDDDEKLDDILKSVNLDIC